MLEKNRVKSVKQFHVLWGPAAVLLGGLALSANVSWSKPEYTRRTNKECDFCHPPHSRELNEAGRYYRDHNKSLQGYKPPKDSKKSN